MPQQFGVRSAGPFGPVVAWSERRLPFEPRGWLKDFRAELRGALFALTAPEGAALCGVYASTDRSLCDLENVLVYNVGPSAFARVGRHGMRLERRFHTALSDPGAPDTALHWWSYGFEPDDGLAPAWHPGVTLATWKQGGWPALSSSTKPAVVWHLLRRGGIACSATALVPDLFGLELELRCPTRTRVSPAGLIKPLVDGIIAALCRHDGTQLEEVSHRVASQLGRQAADIARELAASENAVLGTTTLVRPYRDGVQWHPPDNRLVRIDMAVEESADDTWQIAGRLRGLTSPG